MPVFLHIGCGPNRKGPSTPGFDTPEWEELRVDISPAGKPDILADMTDLSAIAAGSVDAVFSSHNLEHIDAYLVPKALGEFRRVLKPEGYVVVTCPDLQIIAGLVAQGRLNDPIYNSSAGPISALDMIYGHQAAIAAGKSYMAHRCGFTLQTLFDALIGAGFATASAARRRANLELWAVGSKTARPDAELQALAERHFPPNYPVSPAPSPPG